MESSPGSQRPKPVLRTSSPPAHYNPAAYKSASTNTPYATDYSSGNVGSYPKKGDQNAYTNPERKWILIVAILNWFVALVYFIFYSLAESDEYQNMDEPEAVIIGTIIIGLIYFGLWLWTKKLPFVAPLIAMGIFLCFTVLDIMLAPSMIMKGIFFKIGIAYGLFKAVKEGWEMRR